MKKAIIDRVVICGGLLFIGVFAVVGSVFALIAPLGTARFFTEVFSRAFKD